MAEAVAVTQARIPAWTKADLMRYLQNASRRRRPARRTTLEDLAAQAVSARPGRTSYCYRRRNGRASPPGCSAEASAVFLPHGAEKYATQAQLEPGRAAPGPGAGTRRAAPGPRDRGAAARRRPGRLEPGSGPADYAAALAEIAGSGLRMDQAAAAYHLLTSARRAEVMVGPAGTGKTRTAIEMARMWQQAGIGPVVALTASKNARNVLREEAARQGVTLAATTPLNGSATPRRPGIPDPGDLAPGTLISSTKRP